MATKALPWPEMTRRKFLNTLGAKSKGTANPLTWDLPRTGILSKIALVITGSVSGTLSGLNPLGFASVISRIRLIANNGINLADYGPASLGWLLPFQQELRNQVTPATGWSGRTVVSAASFNLSHVLPITLNSRDEMGLVNLQNPDTALQLQVEFLADASVATGATVTCTVTPVVELFTMPLAEESRPSFKFLHVLQEESASVGAAGDYAYQLPRGNVYVSLAHGLGIAAAGGSDLFSSVQFRANGGDVIESAVPGALDVMFSYYRGANRPAGLVLYDWSATSGIGDYGSARDFYDSFDVTDTASVLTATGAGTLYTLKRMLVPLGN